jgi:hypothetical protein
MCGPRGALCAGGVLFGGAGEEVPAVLGLGAIAEVERRFKGRGAVALDTDKEADSGAEGFETGGESGLSGLDVLLPLLCDDEGGLGDFEVEEEEGSF